MDFITAILQLLKEQGKQLGVDFVNVTVVGNILNAEDYNPNTIQIALDKDEFDSVIPETAFPSWFPTYTQAKARAELLKQQAEYYNSYSTPRRRAYPKIEELADAIYWQAKGDNTKMQAYINAVQAVKDEYPKPE